MHNNSAAIFSD